MKILVQKSGWQDAKPSSDFGAAAVKDVLALPATLANGSNGFVDGPVLVTPVKARLLRAFDSGTPYTLVNALRLNDVVLPVVIVQAARFAVVVAFEAANADCQRLLAAAQRRGWLPVCLLAGGSASMVGAHFDHQAANALASTATSRALLPAERDRYLSVAFGKALEVITEQPGQKLPRHVSLRVLEAAGGAGEALAAAAAPQPVTVH